MLSAAIVRLPLPIMSTTVFLAKFTVPTVMLWLLLLACWMKAMLPALGPSKVRVSAWPLPMLKEALPASSMTSMPRAGSRR